MKIGLKLESVRFNGITLSFLNSIIVGGLVLTTENNETTITVFTGWFKESVLKVILASELANMDGVAVFVGEVITISSEHDRELDSFSVELYNEITCNEFTHLISPFLTEKYVGTKIVTNIQMANCS